MKKGISYSYEYHSYQYRNIKPDILQKLENGGLFMHLVTTNWEHFRNYTETISKTCQ